MDFALRIILSIYVFTMIFFMPLMIIIDWYISKSIYRRVGSVLISSVFFIIFIIIVYRIWVYLGHFSFCIT